MLIKCPACGAQVSDAATACPSCGHPLTPSTTHAVLSRMMSGRSGCLTLIVAILALGWVSSLFQSPTKPEPPVASPSSSAGADISASTAKPQNWSYSEDTDPMTDRKTSFACTESMNEALLTFPYHNVKAQLCVRKSPRYGLNAYVSLEGDGQMLCDIEGCSLLIRFGSGKSIRFPAVEPADNSTNTLFIRSTSSLVAKLKKSSTTTIEVNFYQNGAQDLIFNTSGFVWK